MDARLYLRENGKSFRQNGSIRCSTPNGNRAISFRHRRSSGKAEGRCPARYRVGVRGRAAWASLRAGDAVFRAYRTTDNWLALLFQRPLKRPNMGAAILPFGDGLKADLYYPVDTAGKPKTGKFPLVVWLHAYAYHTGYSRYAAAPFQSLTQRGYAVLAFDQLGFGTRVLDARSFYEQYPKWSLMGKMLADTRAAISAGAALDIVDPERIYVIGFGLGAKVGLLAAALDERVKALATVCGFDALRLQSPEKGNRRPASLFRPARVAAQAGLFHRPGSAGTVRLR